MEEEESGRPATSLARASGALRETGGFSGLRPVRLFDPRDIWYEPQVLLTGMRPRLASPDRDNGRSRSPWSPVIEVEYRDDNLVITAELPGLSLEDIKVEIIGNVLILQGERRPERAVGQSMGRTERRYGYFYREIVLPDGVDRDNVRAELDNGILRIVAPLVSRRRTIPVTSASAWMTRQQAGNKKEAA